MSVRYVPCIRLLITGSVILCSQPELALLASIPLHRCEILRTRHSISDEVLLRGSRMYVIYLLWCVEGHGHRCTERVERNPIVGRRQSDRNKRGHPWRG